MILNAEPWYNEPGRESQLNPTISNQYNQKLWGHTLQFATTYWLRSRLAPRTQSSKGKSAVQKGSEAPKVTVPTISSAAQNPGPAPHLNAQDKYASELAKLANAHGPQTGPVAYGGNVHLYLHPTVTPNMSSTVPGPQIGVNHTSAFGYQPPPSAPNSVPPGIPSHYMPGGTNSDGEWLMATSVGHGLQPAIGFSHNGHHFSAHPGDNPPSAFPNTYLSAAMSSVDQELEDSYLGEDIIYSEGSAGSKPEDTDPPSEDDSLWGETLRAYFSINGESAVLTARSSKYLTDKTTNRLRELRDALADHGFIKPVQW